jgi:hypothetical protein
MAVPDPAEVLSLISMNSSLIDRANDWKPDLNSEIQVTSQAALT